VNVTGNAFSVASGAHVWNGPFLGECFSGPEPYISVVDSNDYYNESPQNSSANFNYGTNAQCVDPQYASTVSSDMELAVTNTSLTDASPPVGGDVAPPSTWGGGPGPESGDSPAAASDASTIQDETNSDSTLEAIDSSSTGINSDGSITPAPYNLPASTAQYNSDPGAYQPDDADAVNGWYKVNPTLTVYQEPRPNLPSGNYYLQPCQGCTGNTGGNNYNSAQGGGWAYPGYYGRHSNCASSHCPGSHHNRHITENGTVAQEQGFYGDLCGPGSTTYILDSVAEEYVQDDYPHGSASGWGLNGARVKGWLAQLYSAAWWEMWYLPGRAASAGTWQTWARQEKWYLNWVLRSVGNPRRYQLQNDSLSGAEKVFVEHLKNDLQPGTSQSSVTRPGGSSHLVPYAQRYRPLMTAVTTTGLPGWPGENGLSHFVSVWGYSLAGQLGWADTDPYTYGAINTMNADRYFKTYMDNNTLGSGSDHRVIW
jgi:hypothetical protein